MISVRMFTVLATVVALVLGLAACVDPLMRNGKVGDECITDADCDKPLHCCDNACYECCADHDCKEGEEVCNEDHECEPIEKPPTAPESESEEEQQPPAEVECVEDSECCDLHEGRASYCNDDGKCVALGCKTPADCKEVCPTGNWDCIGDLCLEADECTEDKECCDLHPGEVWKCDDDIGKCVKVGCDEDVDCKICPGEWKCEPPFGDCVKATPTPDPQCTDDADCDPDADAECVDGECRPREPEEPAPPPLPKPECTVNQDCDGGVCDDGICTADTTGPVISNPYPPDAEMGHCCIGLNCEGLPTDIPYSVTVSDPSGVVTVWWRCGSCAGEREQNRGDFVRGEGDEWFFTWVPHAAVLPGEFTYYIDTRDTLGNASSWQGTGLTFKP